MYNEGDPVKVKKDGEWIAATFGEVAEGQPKHIDHPGVNLGAGYEVDQAWVIYQEGDLAGTGGLHAINEEIRPGDFEPEAD